MVELRCHAATPAPAVEHIDVDVVRNPGGTLSLAFRLAGAVSRLRIPVPRAPRIGTDLWRHTCFEAFVGIDGLPAYHELNFSPSGEWAAFAFRAYRDGAPLADQALAPAIAVRLTADTLALDATVRLAALAAGYPGAALRVALAAVVEDDGGALSYWGLRHAAGKPDFHHDTAFALRLEPP